jgi:Protein of unknown function (DUF3761)
MKRLMGIVLALVILVGALSSHGKTSSPTSAGSTTPSLPVPQAAAPSKSAAAHVQYKACDQNISAGSATTCGFADNVFRGFARKVSSEGASPANYTVSAASPTTGKTYSMSCLTSGETTFCTGGHSARVRFPLHAAQIYNQTSSPRPKSTPSYSGGEPETEQPASEEPTPAEPEGKPSEAGPECTNGTYVNAAGNTVCSPEESPNGPPVGATARCEDGTYSFSESRSGTCSHHGGVSEWL